MMDMPDISGNGWFDNISCTCPLRWYLDSIMPFASQDYMYCPLMVIEHAGVSYLVERTGPSKITVLGTVEDGFGCEPFTYTPMTPQTKPVADPGSIESAITESLSMQAFKKGYKWMPEDRLRQLTDDLWEFYGDFEAKFDN